MLGIYISKVVSDLLYLKALQISYSNLMLTVLTTFGSPQSKIPGEW